LRGLLAKTAGLVDLLRDALQPFADRIPLAFVYGSVARAEEVSASDVDLFIVGTVGLFDIAPPLRDAQRRLGREISPKIYPPQELAKRLASREHFVLNVLGKPKLFIYGTQDELDDVVGREAGGGGAIE
jgi:predicted nucleotidyltransferase